MTKVFIYQKKFKKLIPDSILIALSILATSRLKFWSVEGLDKHFLIFFLLKITPDTYLAVKLMSGGKLIYD